MDLVFNSAFSGRYGDDMIKEIFSPTTKFTTWRKLWYILANSQYKLGVPIPLHVLTELDKARMITDVEMRVAADYEEKTHHDVYAHILTLGEVCPTAKPYIHLGAISCYITDNTDIIQMRTALVRLSDMLSDVIHTIVNIAADYSDQPTIGYTHYQPAQLTTVGKRFVMWADALS